MKLYHGTSSRFKDDILANGLRPRGDRESLWEKYPSRSDMVYLTTAYGFYFALAHDYDDDGIKIVFEIESDRLDQDLLFPDEDFVAQLHSHRLNAPLETIHDDLRDNLEEITFRSDDGQQISGWQLSITATTTCCYKGIIPPQAITRYCIFHSRLRPRLTAMCFNEGPHLGGPHEDHRRLGLWMFGNRKKLPRFVPTRFIAMLGDMPDVHKAAAALTHINYKQEEESRLGIEIVNK